jgi:cytoskeleton protein RodZ
MTNAMQEHELGAREPDRVERDGFVPPPEDSVGATLARARAACGFTLEDVAQQLKFGPRQLEALEQDRFDNLPGGTFARGMVRSYARLLKLDADALLERMQGKFNTPDSSQLAARFNQPVPFSDASRRSNLIYAVLSVLILVAVAGVLIEWQQERSKATRLTFIPAAQVPLEPPRPVAAKPAQDKAAPAAPAAPAAAAPAAAAAAAAASAAADKPAPAVSADTGRIVFQFDKESWVEVRDATGHRLLAQLMPGGSTRVIDGKPPFALVIGNAQYVHVVYEGQPFDLKPYIRVEVARFTLK